MKAEKFYEMTNAELEKKIDDLKIDLFNLRFKHAIKQLSNPMVLVECKKDIARAKTVLRQRELGMVEEPVKATKKKSKKTAE